MATFAPPRADASTATKWFEDTTTVDGAFRELLENYSHVPPADVVRHVVKTVSHLLSANIQRPG